MSASQQAIGIARTWLGTPFQVGASVQGIGTDCAGLIEGIAHQLGVACPSRKAFEQDLLAAVASALVMTTEPEEGCVILFSTQPGGAPLHAAILTDTGTLIHAHWRAGVVENRFGNWFKVRVTDIFVWPQSSSAKDN